MSATNSKKPFQRIIRYPSDDVQVLSRHVELFEDNVAKKFRGVDALVQAVVNETPTPADIPDDRIFASLDFAIGSGSIADKLIYTVPSLSDGSQFVSSGGFILSRPIVWLTTTLAASDTGNVNVRIGTSLGGNDIMTDQNVTSANTHAVIGGLSIASLGTSMLAANGYEAALSVFSHVYIRATTTGTITRGTVRVELFGYFFPTPSNG